MPADHLDQFVTDAIEQLDLSSARLN